MDNEFQVEVLQRLTSIETKLNNGINEKLKDQETRLRFLEKSIYIAIGGLALLQIALKYFIR